MSPATIIVPLMQAVAILIIIRSGQSVAQQNEFRDVSSCVCPGCELTVECTLTSGGATVWQGTIFDGCQDEKITLRHSQFNTSEGVQLSQSCGTRGPIVGRSVSVTGGSFTSQLTVNVSEDLRGKTIECANESGQRIGSKQIDIPSDKPPNITLSEVNVDQLTFTWDSITSSSSAVQYFVSASNCVCPNTTNSSSVRCNITNTSNPQCSLRIQTVHVICGRIGSVSDPFIVALKVPHPPRAQIMQVTEAFALVVTTFNKTELISLADETTAFSALATSYTINYSDSSSGETCGSSTIPASSCDDRICINVFEVSSTSCSDFSNIAVSFFAGSRLGNGPTSERTVITLQQCNDSVQRRDYMYPMCMRFEEITFIAVGVAAFSILALLTAVFVSVTAALIRSKWLIQKELNNIKESQDDKKESVYEEITLPASTVKVIETNENAAYTCISRVCANSGL